MALIHCPDCGAQVSDTAVVCSQCGFPLRRDVLAAATAGGGGGGGGSSNAKSVAIAAGVLGVGCVGFVAIGIVAALVIPRFTNVARGQKEVEAERMLRQAYTLEQAYLAAHGTYAESFAELGSVGWTEPVETAFYDLEIASADSSGFCLNALPRKGSYARPLRLGTSGAIEGGVRCGAPAFHEGRSQMGDATGVLRDVAASVSAWRRDHGHLPSNVSELVDAYPSAADDPDFAMGLAPTGPFCMFIAPRTRPPSTPLLSLDGAGNVYSGEGCRGAAVEHFER